MNPRLRQGAPEAPLVVIADGDRGARESFRHILDAEHRVLTAASRDGLSSLLARERADVVLVDLALPGAEDDGWLGALRRSHPDVAFVATAARIRLATARELVASGIAELIPKPIDVAEVAATLARALLAQRQRSHLVGFLRALGRLVGNERQVGQILGVVEGDGPLRRQVGELVGWTSRRMVRVERSRDVTAVRGEGITPGSAGSCNTAAPSAATN